MKKTLLSALFVLFISFSVHAQTTCKQTIEQIAQDAASAFEAKKLGRLDAKRGKVGRVRLTMENSLADDDDPGRFIVKTFANLKALEKSLYKPAGRNADSFRCKKGVCVFAGEALLHNNLYLKKITFGYTKNKCPFIKSIFILDGN